MNTICPVENDTIRHYAEQDRSEDLQAEVRRYVDELTQTQQGRNTVLEEEYMALDTATDRLIASIVSTPISIDTINAVKEFRQTFFVAASRIAGRLIAADIKSAQEDHAVERFMRRQEARCEP